jgi:hypothetical protein
MPGNASESNRFNCGFNSNEIDERDWHKEKQDEPRVSTSRGITMDCNEDSQMKLNLQQKYPLLIAVCRSLCHIIPGPEGTGGKFKIELTNLAQCSPILVFVMMVCYLCLSLLLAPSDARLADRRTNLM